MTSTEKKSINQVVFEDMFFNTTPHEINLILGEDTWTLPRCKKPWRLERNVTEQDVLRCSELKIPVNTVEYSVSDMELPGTILEVYLEIGNDEYMETAQFLYDPDAYPDLTLHEYVERVYGSEACIVGKKIGRFYIVSKIFQDAYPDRDDFLIVDDLVRDENGNIIGCRAFSYG